MIKNKVFANFNMSFNNGSFKKDSQYFFEKDNDKKVVYVQTEEGKKQDFSFLEFDMLFSFLKI